MVVLKLEILKYLKTGRKTYREIQNYVWQKFGTTETALCAALAALERLNKSIIYEQANDTYSYQNTAPNPIHIECPHCKCMQIYQPAENQKRNRPTCRGCGKKTEISKWIRLSDPNQIKRLSKQSNVAENVLDLIKAKTAQTAKEICLALNQKYAKINRILQFLLLNGYILQDGRRNKSIKYAAIGILNTPTAPKIQNARIGDGRLHNIMFKARILRRPVQFTYDRTEHPANWTKFIRKYQAWDIEICTKNVVFRFKNHIFTKDTTDAKIQQQNYAKIVLTELIPLLEKDGFLIENNIKICGKEQLAYKRRSDLAEFNTTIIDDDGNEIIFDESDGSDEVETTIETWDQLFSLPKELRTKTSKIEKLENENAQLKTKISELEQKLATNTNTSELLMKISELEQRLIGTQTDVSILVLDKTEYSSKINLLDQNVNKLANIALMQDKRITNVEMKIED